MVQWLRTMFKMVTSLFVYVITFENRTVNKKRIRPNSQLHTYFVGEAIHTY